MPLQLEDLSYQQQAIDAVVALFDGQGVRERPLLADILKIELTQVQAAAGKPPKATDDERTRIQCAQKHFAALGLPVQFIAPVKDYAQGFKARTLPRLDSM